MPQVKVIIVGKFGVGKSSILFKFKQGLFTQNIGPTTGMDFLSSNFQHNGTDYFVQFWDTSGQQRYRSLIKIYYKGAKIAFVVLSADKDVETSLQDLRQLINQFQDINSIKAIHVYVNKIDMVEENQMKANWKENEGLIEKLKKQTKVKSFYFVSAKTTSQEQFVKIMHNSVVELFEQKEETVPSAISVPQKDETMKLNKSKKKKSFKSGNSGNTKCCN